MVTTRTGTLAWVTATAWRIATTVIAVLVSLVPITTPRSTADLATSAPPGMKHMLRHDTGDRGRTGDVQLGKLSWPLRHKGFSAAIAETG
jgi:hypothetical protein